MLWEIADFGQTRIAHDIDSSLPRRIVPGKLGSMSHVARAREVFDIELDALKPVRAQLAERFDRAVHAIVQAPRRPGKIVVVGIGKSGNVGQKIAATLTSTGSTSVVLNSVDALHGDLGIVNDGDVIVALSYSGESEELLNLLPALKRFSIKLVALTGAVGRLLYSDVVLNVRVKEACPLTRPDRQHRDARLGRRAGDGSLAGARPEARLREVSSSGAIGRALLLRVGTSRAPARATVAPTLTVKARS